MSPRTKFFWHFNVLFIFSGICGACALSVFYFFYRSLFDIQYAAAFFLAVVIYGFSINATLYEKVHIFRQKKGVTVSPKKGRLDWLLSFAFLIQLMKYILVSCFFYVIVTSYQELFFSAFTGFVFGLFSGSGILLALSARTKLLFQG